MNAITHAERQPDGTASSMTAREDQPLIGVVVRRNGEEVVRYFADEDEADKALAREDSLQAALSVVGAWRDLDWDETIANLERIRHQSTPTPPIDDL